MKKEENRVKICCPCCKSNKNDYWAEENTYIAVKCLDCGFIFVNPRPSLELISDAVKTGVHTELSTNRDAISRRVDSKVDRYRKLFSKQFKDVWGVKEPISWLDVGAGYGEIVEALNSLVTDKSTIVGIEPMRPKVEKAHKLGLDVREGYLKDIEDKFDYISIINIFSHIPNFDIFLEEIKEKLQSNGELFLETGNIGDLDFATEAPSELDLPDHLTFAGEKNIIAFLENAGFSIISIERKRVDSVFNSFKNIIKLFLGRKVSIRFPYTSNYRTLLIRAKLA